MRLPANTCNCRHLIEAMAYQRSQCRFLLDCALQHLEQTKQLSAI